MFIVFFFLIIYAWQHVHSTILHQGISENCSSFLPSKCYIKRRLLSCCSVTIHVVLYCTWWISSLIMIVGWHFWNFWFFVKDDVGNYIKSVQFMNKLPFKWNYVLYLQQHKYYFPLWYSMTWHTFSTYS